MDHFVWLSKSNNTGRNLFDELCLLGFKIISTYFPEPLAPSSSLVGSDQASEGSIAC